MQGEFRKQHRVRWQWLLWLAFGLSSAGLTGSPIGFYETPPQIWPPQAFPRNYQPQGSRPSGRSLPGGSTEQDKLNLLAGSRNGLVPADTGLAVGNLDDKQKLAVGDTVIFRVVEDQEDPKLLMVSDTGDVNVPELGLVAARGKTCKQLAAEIKQRLEHTSYYQATVLVGVGQLNPTLSGRKVFIMGQVNNTGPLEIPAGETWTVSRAVVAAGGFTDFANSKVVRLIRRDPKSQQSQVFIVNVKQLWHDGKTAQDIAIEPEDIIYVPMRHLF